MSKRSTRKQAAMDAFRRAQGQVQARNAAARQDAIAVCLPCDREEPLPWATPRTGA